MLRTLSKDAAAASATKKASSVTEQYQDYYRSGCEAGVGDRKQGKSMDHTRHSGACSGSTVYRRLQQVFC